ncbi:MULTISPECIES: hypothetical protein [unclassified Ruegeria]|uniref:hypothetical protein n=1 Tax=unclassified Ruegeria TaxID=2625375 RepID=UPI0014889156|nr:MULTISPECIES: hypothetical protein [unclassified Ruegeria]
MRDGAWLFEGVPPVQAATKDAPSPMENVRRLIMFGDCSVLMIAHILAQSLNPSQNLSAVEVQVFVMGGSLLS